MVEILAWLLVLLEIQMGLGLLLLWAFRRGEGFAHLEVAGLAVTVYTGGHTAGGRGGTWKRTLNTGPARGKWRG